MRRGGNWAFAVSVAGVLAASMSTLPASPQQAAEGLGAATFENAVSPVLANTCSLCHNRQLASGGFDAAAFLDPASVASKREGWELILQIGKRCLSRSCKHLLPLSQPPIGVGRL